MMNPTTPQISSLADAITQIADWNYDPFPVWPTREELIKITLTTRPNFATQPPEVAVSLAIAQADPQATVAEINGEV